MTILQTKALDIIIQGFEDEAQRPRHEESGYGVELFRRAVEEDNSQAWEAIYRQYNALIHRWIHNGRTISMSPEEIEDLIQEIWMKFYRNLAKKTVPLLERFKHMGAFLNYLKRCVFTVVTDHYRRLTKQDKLQKVLKKNQKSFYAPPDVLVLDRLSREVETRVVREWIANQITDPQEQLLFHCSYVLDLTPAEIYRRYPDEFQSVRRIYRIKERLLKRAKRFFEIAIQNKYR